MKRNKLGIRIEVGYNGPYELGHTISLHSSGDKNIEYRTRVFFDGLNMPVDFGIFIKKYLNNEKE